MEDPTYMVEQIDQHGEGLSQWEIDFIADMVDYPEENLSDKQIEIITRIYNQKVNR